jgi:hypothetical protein
LIWEFEEWACANASLSELSHHPTTGFIFSDEVGFAYVDVSIVWELKVYNCCDADLHDD